jgi:hypothetical protein
MSDTQELIAAIDQGCQELVWLLNEIGLWVGYVVELLIAVLPETLDA